MACQVKVGLEQYAVFQSLLADDKNLGEQDN